MSPVKRSRKRSTLCRSRDGATQTKSRNRCGAPCVLPSPSVGTKSPSATSTCSWSRYFSSPAGTLSGGKCFIFIRKPRIGALMFRWFAPLLLFAAKPEVMIRILGAAVAAAILFFGVWLISNIAVTVDTLKNPTIAIIYGAVILIFFSVVTAVGWLGLPRVAAPVKAVPPPTVAPLPPLTDDIVNRRAKELVGKWDTESRAVGKPPVRVNATPAAPASPATQPRPPA